MEFSEPSLLDGEDNWQIVPISMIDQDSSISTAASSKQIKQESTLSEEANERVFVNMMDRFFGITDQDLDIAEAPKASNAARAKITQGSGVRTETGMKRLEGQEKEQMKHETFLCEVGQVTDEL